MKKEQFLRELERLLQDISQDERMEAMQYYMDYFDDAGPEKEEQIIKELGSPEKVARTIKAGLGEGDGEFSERGYRDSRFEQSQELGPRAAADQQTSPWTEQKQRTNGWKVAFLVLLCILLFPVIVPLAIIILAVLFTVVVTVVALAIGIGAAALALLIAGVVMIGFGIVKAFLTPAAGLALAGIGCLLLAIGGLGTLLIVWCCVKFIPWLIRGIVRLLSIPFQKRKEAGTA
ncbi:MAG: DUF1700 domain-containing protein [Lachnospiraceae bacterium]|nr:DUF1700 domain-containing protein [Lachnospiraceae bacterium]